MLFITRERNKLKKKKKKRSTRLLMNIWLKRKLVLNGRKKPERQKK